MNKNRREFLKTIGLLAGIISVPKIVIASISAPQSVYTREWMNEKALSMEYPIIERMEQSILRKVLKNTNIQKHKSFINKEFTVEGIIKINELIRNENFLIDRTKIKIAGKLIEYEFEYLNRYLKMVYAKYNVFMHIEPSLFIALNYCIKDIKKSKDLDINKIIIHPVQFADINLEFNKYSLNNKNIISYSIDSILNIEIIISRQIKEGDIYFLSSKKTGKYFVKENISVCGNNNLDNKIGFTAKEELGIYIDTNTISKMKVYE